MSLRPFRKGFSIRYHHLLCYILLSSTFGMHQYTADYANRMAAAGHDVHLIITTTYLAAPPGGQPPPCERTLRKRC